MECALVPVTGDSGIPRERRNDGDDGKSGGGTNCMERGKTLSAACVKQRLLGGGSSKSTALRRGSQGSAGSPARRSARGRRARPGFRAWGLRRQMRLNRAPHPEAGGGPQRVRDGAGDRGARRDPGMQQRAGRSGEALRPARTVCNMGGTRLELVTSTMSTWRSNQLS